MVMMRRVRHPLRVVCPLVVSLWAAAGFGSHLRADVLHLDHGDEVVCEVLEDLGDAYRVRTLIGVVDIDKDRIVRHEKGPAPWRLYEKRRKRCPDTAKGHYDLARWCRRHGLRPEEREQLARVIALDPDHAGARRVLGYTQENGAWVKPRSHKGPTPEELAAQRAEKEEERILRKLVSQWFRKIKPIHRANMTGRKAGLRSEKFRRAREQILAIRDPLAVPALTGVLGAGNAAARHVLVEALAQFDCDEATMDLVLMALLDPSPQNRRLAAVALKARGDDRIVEHLRKALVSDEEYILRNAAAALGVMQAREAFADLVSVLTTEERRSVRMSRPVYLDSIYDRFGCGYRHGYGGRWLYYRPRLFTVLSTEVLVGTYSWTEVRTVSVYRTEVQDALIAITGQNHGFDAAAWREWRRGQPD
jgi:hypothetical protein